MKFPWNKPKPNTYRCYWLCLHFASAEDAASFWLENENVKTLPQVRLLRGAETVPVCHERT